MKSYCFSRSTHFALLTLASAAFAAPMPASSAPDTNVTAPQMIDAFEGTFGAHAGQRRNHIKGTCAAGEFIGTSDAAALSRSVRNLVCEAPVGAVRDTAAWHRSSRLFPWR